MTRPVSHFSDLVQRLSLISPSLNDEEIRDTPALMHDITELFQHIQEISQQELSRCPPNVRQVLGELVVQNKTKAVLSTDVTATLFRSQQFKPLVIPYIAQFYEETHTLIFKNPDLNGLESKDALSLVSPEVLAQTKTLVIEDCFIENLEFLDRFPNLKGLRCIYCPFLKDVSALSRQHNLEELTLFHCNSLQALHGLQGDFPLRTLNVEGSILLESLEGIEHFPLQELNVSKCLSLRTFSLIKNLSRLRKLNLTNITRFDDLSILLALRALEEVRISGTAIDPSALAREHSNHVSIL